VAFKLTWKEESIVGSRTRLTRYVSNLPLVGKIHVENHPAKLGWRVCFVERGGMRMDLVSVRPDDAKVEAVDRILSLYGEAAKALKEAIGNNQHG
jgi:hypothetical protein